MDITVIDYTDKLDTIIQSLNLLISLCGYIFASTIILISVIVLICIAKILNKTIFNHF